MNISLYKCGLYLVSMTITTIESCVVNNIWISHCMNVVNIWFLRLLLQLRVGSLRGTVIIYINTFESEKEEKYTLIYIYCYKRRKKTINLYVWEPLILSVTLESINQC